MSNRDFLEKYFPLMLSIWERVKAHANFKADRRFILSTVLLVALLGGCYALYAIGTSIQPIAANLYAQGYNCTFKGTPLIGQIAGTLGPLKLMGLEANNSTSAYLIKQYNHYKITYCPTPVVAPANASADELRLPPDIQPPSNT